MKYKRDGTTKATDLELYGHHVQRGRAGQDGGVGLQKASQCRATVPEEQRVPGQEAGAEVRLTHQHGDLGGVNHHTVLWYVDFSILHSTTPSHTLLS